MYTFNISCYKMPSVPQGCGLWRVKDKVAIGNSGMCHGCCFMSWRPFLSSSLLMTWKKQENTAQMFGLVSPLCETRMKLVDSTQPSPGVAAI